jgi:hypothetical protein
LAARIGAFGKLGIAAVMLVAASGAGYYPAIYAPQRDAEREAARVLAQTQVYAQRRAAQVRLAAQERDLAEQQFAEKAAAEVRYQAFLASASVSRETSWAAACKAIAERALANHADCLTQAKLSRGYCDAAYRARDGSANCVLPVAAATDVDGGLTRAQRRCLQEHEAALQ